MNPTQQMLFTAVALSAWKLQVGQFEQDVFTVSDHTSTEMEMSYFGLKIDKQLN